MSDIRIEFVLPIEIPMSALQEFLTEYQDIPHLGGRKEPINTGSASWGGQELDRDDHHERAEATFDRAPSYLEFESLDVSLEDEFIEAACKAETDEYMVEMTELPEDVVWRALHFAFVAGDLTAGEADRMYLALTDSEDLMGLIEYA